MCHRRSGKTVGLINDLIIGAMETQLHRPQFAYVGPTHVQAKRVAWEYLKDYARPVMYPGTKPNESELRVDVVSASGTPGRILLAGADNPDSLRGMYFDGAVLDEAPLQHPSVWSQIILPALADRQGWGVLAGTPKGKNWFYEAYKAAVANPEEWHHMMLRASESNLLPPEELQALKEKMDEDEYLQEMECSWEATTRGRILSKYVEQADREGRINDNVMWDPNGAPIEVSSDIGFRDTAAWWFWQPTMDGYKLLKYIEGSGKDAEDWSKDLQECGYRIHTLWLPQDAKAQTMAAAASVQEQMQAHGFAVTLVPRVSVRDRINAARVVLRKAYFNRKECEKGIESLLNWTYKWNDETYSYSRDPHHDKYSHGGDAFTYGACTVFGASPVSQETSVIALPDYSVRVPRVKRALSSHGR